MDTRNGLPARRSPGVSAAGCLIGAVDRSPRAQLLFDNVNAGPGHSLIFAGPGSHKSVTAVTRIWHWNGPRVVFDPSCKIGPIMTEALQAEGFNVVSIGLDGHGLNVLDWLDPAPAECDSHIRTVVDHIWNSAGATRSDARGNADPFWETQGRALCACLLAHLVYSPDSPKTLVALRRGIATPEAEFTGLLKGTWRTTVAECLSHPGSLRKWEIGFLQDLPEFHRISVKQRYVLQEIARRVLGRSEP
jgi:hypothetical protein